MLLSPEVEEISVLRVCCFKENDGSGGRLCSASELGDCNLLVRGCDLGNIESDEASSDDNDNDERDTAADEDCWCSEIDEKPEYDGSAVAVALVGGEGSFFVFAILSSPMPSMLCDEKGSGSHLRVEQTR